MKRLKKAVSLFLCVCILLTLLPVVAVASETGVQLPTPQVELLKESGDTFVSVIGNSEGIAKEDELTLRFTWDSIPLSGENAISTGVPYELGVIPNTLALNGELQKTISVWKDGQTAPVVCATIDATQTEGGTKLTIQFHADTGFDVLSLTYDCVWKLDFSKVTEIKEGKRVTIGTLPFGEAPVSVVVSDYDPAPTIQKKVVQDTFTPPGAKSSVTADFGEDGTVQWEITYTAPLAGYEGAPTQIVDTLPDYMEYVGGSAKVGGAAVETGNAAGQIAATAGAYGRSGDNLTVTTLATLTYTLPGGLAAGETVTLTYKTMLIFEVAAQYQAAVKSNNESLYTYVKTFENAAVMRNADNAPVGDPATATATISKSWVDACTPITKTGTYRSGQLVDWTVEVETIGAGVDTLTLVDTMGEYLTLDTGSVSVSYRTNASDTWHALSGRAVTSPVPGETNQMKVEIKKTGETLYAAYQITYTTKMSDEYFSSDNESDANEKVQNSASLKVTFVGGIGPGPGVNWLDAILNKDPTLPSNIGNVIAVAKGSDYNPSDQSMTYTVSVNPGGVKLQNGVKVTVTQKGNGYGWELTNNAATMEAAIQTAIQAAITNAGLAGLAMVEGSFGQETLSDGMTQFSFTLNGLGAGTFTFAVPARVTDPSFYARNRGNTDFDLKASADYKVVDNNTSRNKSASASITAKSTVLQKTVTSYDPAAKTITWSVTANANKATLGNVIVYDVLPAGLTYETGTLTGSTLTQNVSVTANSGGVTEGGTQQALKWTIPASLIDGQAPTWTYTTTIDELTNGGTPSRFLTEEKVAFQNEAWLLSGSGDTAQTQYVACTATMENGKTMVKTGTQTSDRYKITYQVLINPYEMDLSADGDNRLTLKDTIGANQILDVKSITLSNASFAAVTPVNNLLDPAAKMSPGAEAGTIQEDSQTFALSGTGDLKLLAFDQTSFQISVPDQKALVLRYDVYATANGTLANKIEPQNRTSGMDVLQDAYDSQTSASGIGSGSGIRYPESNFNLTIQNVDGYGETISVTSPAEPASYTLSLTVKDSQGNTVKDGEKDLKIPLVDTPFSCGNDGSCVVSFPKGAVAQAIAAYETAHPGAWTGTPTANTILVAEKHPATGYNPQTADTAISWDALKGNDPRVTIRSMKTGDLGLTVEVRYYLKDTTTVLKEMVTIPGQIFDTTYTAIAPTILGYTLVTADCTPVGSNQKTITIKKDSSENQIVFYYEAGEGTPYQVEHYQQNLSGDGYTLQETEHLTGKSDSAVTATAKTYPGFTENTTHASRVSSGTVRGDGTLALRLYYDRNTYTVTYTDGVDGETVFADQISAPLRYGADTPAYTGALRRDGYNFGGWKSSVDNKVLADTKVPVTETVTYTAQWIKVETPPDADGNQSLATQVVGPKDANVDAKMDAAVSPEELKEEAGKLLPGESMEVVVNLTVSSTSYDAKEKVEEKLTPELTAQQTLVEFVDIDLDKITRWFDGSNQLKDTKVVNPLKTTADYLDITLPLTSSLLADLKRELDNGSEVSLEHVLVFRHHVAEDGTETAEALRKVSAAQGPTAAYDCYYVETVGGKEQIVLHSKKFSTYVFGVQTTPVQEYVEPSSGGGSGGGGGGSGSAGQRTLTYVSNGGTVYQKETYANGKTVTLTKTPMREGYTFLGWYADAALTQPIQSVTLNASKTVYAGWVLTEIPEILNGDNHFAYVMGYRDGFVRPLDNISRAEVTTIFFRLLKPEVRDGNLTSENSFTDIGDTMWCRDPVSTMTKLGIVNGRTPTLFEPGKPITRAEFAVICARFSDLTDANSNFTDIAGHWGETEIRRAATLGWVSGYQDGTFRPDQNITRAEAMTMINRVLHRIPTGEEALLADMVVWPDNQPDAWYYLAVQEATNSHDFSRSGELKEDWKRITDVPDWLKYEQ